LLVFKASIYCQQDIKSGGLCFCEKFAVFESAEASLPRRLAVMTRQETAQLLIDTLIDQDAQLGAFR